MRRFLLVATVAALLTASLATPALADRPVEFTQVVTFEDLNPCDPPNMDEITITFNFRVHEHRNNTVLVIDSTVSTTAGFEGNGHETTVFANNAFSSTFNFVSNNPETGEKMTVKGHMTDSNGELRVDRFTMRCVKDV